MKIGILTYHRSHNYGALLQAVALRTVLTEMGNEVTFIDYWPAYHQHMYAQFSSENMKNHTFKENFRYILRNIIKYKIKRERIQNFNGFINVHILPFLSQIDETYDLVVCGSDQIWRKQREMYSFNPVYFGNNNINATRQISYAASMGIITCDENDKALLKEYLSHLHRISVRESSLRNLVEGLGYHCELNLDPTLLLDRDKWISMMDLQTSTTEKYILLYKIQSNAFDDNLILEYANKRNLKLKTLYGGPAKKNTEYDITTAGPQEFLSLISGAEVVFTSSYHGLVFSLLLHKQFYTSFSKNSERAISLLSMLGLSERLLEPRSTIPENLKNIDFEKTDSIIAEQRRMSIKYLQDNCM